jgi:hypothetical protein
VAQAEERDSLSNARLAACSRRLSQSARRVSTLDLRLTSSLTGSTVFLSAHFHLVRLHNPSGSFFFFFFFFSECTAGTPARRCIAYARYSTV